MMPMMSLIKKLLVLCLLINGSTEIERTLELIPIHNLKNYCEQRKCVNLNFGNINEMAIFDVKPNVQISDDSTYDINPLYDTDVLIFENSTFANFPMDLFSAFTLIELDLRNCSVEKIMVANFYNAGWLKILLLSDNKLTEIDDDTFSFATGLQFLFLDSNQIENLNSGSFSGLSELNHLDLHNNNIIELPEKVFEPLNNLYQINLSGNRIQTLDENLFLTNQLLNTILLNNNEIVQIPENLCQPIKNIALLDFSYNALLEVLVLNLQGRILLATNCGLQRINIYGKVKTVDLSHNQILELYFSEPDSLEELTLRDNALEQIASLARATSLRYLDLADNAQLGILPDDNDWNIHSLEVLDLSNTSLTIFPLTIVAANENLHRLNIANNQIKEINPKNYKYLEHLTHFLIHANDWNCYNLNNLMTLLIQPQGISYTIDEMKEDFPGEYIRGIACMYRIEEQEENNDNLLYSSSSEVVASLDSPTSEQLRINSDNSEIVKLRSELRAIVGFYEEKFDTAFRLINDLNERLDRFEKLNETLWQQITISV